ncbi:YetF domain-containing protein [Methanoculleus sp.]|uniref:YetF domain-containing protein n=1 Tax=Methanoculleus sp. TaxID=90427 RepID=UPI0025E2AC29|nr:YetF domain-containing protein [Methanoculleus sp.]
MLISIGQYKSRRFRSIVSPEALKVIEDGKVIEKSLRRELMTHDDLIEQLARRILQSRGIRPDRRGGRRPVLSLAKIPRGIG